MKKGTVSYLNGFGSVHGRFQFYVEAAALRDADLPTFVAFQFEDDPVIAPDAEGVLSVSVGHDCTWEPMRRKP